MRDGLRERLAKKKKREEEKREEQKDGDLQDHVIFIVATDGRSFFLSSLSLCAFFLSPSRSRSLPLFLSICFYYYRYHHLAALLYLPTRRGN